MKRIKSACLIKTLLFQPKDGSLHTVAMNEVKNEVAQYKTSLDRKRVPYKLLSEIEQPDGSISLEKKCSTAMLHILSKPVQIKTLPI